MGHIDIFDRYVAAIKNDLVPKHITPVNARSLTERMAKAMQAAQLIKNGDPLVAEAYCLGRLQNGGGLMFGTLPPDVDCKAIVDRV